jgi:hypothetical protein
MAETKESRTLAVFVLSPDTTKASVKAFVAGLPTADLPKVIVRAREVGGLVKAIVSDGEAEMRLRAAANAEGAIAPGQRWVDPDTGVVHLFEGELSSWKVADPAGLRDALASLKGRDGSQLVAQADIDRAVVPTYKPNHVVLNELARTAAAVREVIDRFREKTRGPAHLKGEED